MNQPQSPQQAWVVSAAMQPWEPTGHQAQPGESKLESRSQPVTHFSPPGLIQKTAPTERVPGSASFTPAELLVRADLNRTPFKGTEHCCFCKKRLLTRMIQLWFWKCDDKEMVLKWLHFNRSGVWWKKYFKKKPVFIIVFNLFSMITDWADNLLFLWCKRILLNE